MQPELQKLSSEHVSYNQSSITVQSTQHGLVQDDTSTSDDLTPEGFHTSGSSDRSISTAEPSGLDIQYDNGLSNPTTGATPTSYAIMNSIKSPDESVTGKSVKKKTRSRAGITVQNLPNELLIHALSHLVPTDLMSVSLVNKEFYSLVNSPDSWRAAFARFFPGPAVIKQTARGPIHDDEVSTLESFRSDRRRFCRLTQVSTWREEYITRAHLLRALERGRPMQTSLIHSQSSTGQVIEGTPTAMYTSPCIGQITQLRCNFETNNPKQAVSILLGCSITSEAVLSTEAVDNQLQIGWSTYPDPIRHFNEIHIGEAPWGLGSGNMVGCPNVLDLSREYGAIYGEGLPGGHIFFQAIQENSPRQLVRPDLTVALNSLDPSQRPLGVPTVATAFESITAVWIVKSSVIPYCSNGMIGMIYGSSHGILSSYSMGWPGIREEHLNRAELTARWVLCPGVPIIAIAVDDDYSLQRQAQNRVWAIVLNALGEVFYLSQMPQRATSPQRSEDGTLRDLLAESLAWESGRSVYWRLVEPTRRMGRPDPYKDCVTDGSYTPRSSWKGMCLSEEQVKAETAEIQTFLNKTPKEIQTMCLGWDMRRRLEVDFAGDDGNFAGESIIVSSCGLDEQSQSQVHRYTRFKVKQSDSHREHSLGKALESKFGQISKSRGARSGHDSSTVSSTGSSSPERISSIEEWRVANLTFGSGKPSFSITCNSIDCSKLAKTTLSEDPLAGSGDDSNLSANVQSFFARHEYLIPGQRARFFAVGTNTGVVYLWDMRISSQKNIIDIDPIRIIYTSSPEIRCLGLTALYLVHGGSDGLVQLWDPLASTVEPIRTINGRVSMRTRRRLNLLASRFPSEWGIDMVGANAVILDSRPHRLRGIVAVGVQVKTWSFRSSNLFISGKAGKRKVKKSTSRRGSTPVSGPRTDLLDSIQEELEAMKAEQKEALKERKRLAQRFGVGMLDEHEEMQLALMLSTEAFATEPQSSDTSSKTTPTVDQSREQTQTFNDTDLAEAIRRSLRDSEAYSPEPMSSPSSLASQSTWHVPIKFAKKGLGIRPSTSGSSPSISSGEASSAFAVATAAQEAEDLEMAIRLSIEEQTQHDRNQADVDAFPTLPSSLSGKGKERRRS